MPMNFRVVLKVQGTVIKLLGISLFIPLLVALYYSEIESVGIFAVSAAFAFLMGTTLELTSRAEVEELTHRESIVIVALGWLLAAMFGSVPYLLSGLAPVDSFFESMAGFTTTGSSILVDIESHSKSLLFWRNMTQWPGASD
jgi:trk system potassium uptake protein TrkH